MFVDHKLTEVCTECNSIIKQTFLVDFNPIQSYKIDLFNIKF